MTLNSAMVVVRRGDLRDQQSLSKSIPCLMRQILRQSQHFLFLTCIFRVIKSSVAARPPALRPVRTRPSPVAASLCPAKTPTSRQQLSPPAQRQLVHHIASAHALGPLPTASPLLIFIIIPYTSHTTQRGSPILDARGQAKIPSRTTPPFPSSHPRRSTAYLCHTDTLNCSARAAHV